MDKNDLRIVFFGTPEFAVESLRRLVEGGYNIVGVVTMPDKVGGRGNKLIQSAVKQYAVEKGLRLLQPVKLKDEAFVEELRSLQAHLQIAAQVSWCGTHQLGCHEWRHHHRRDHVLPQARNRHGRRD